MKRLLAVLMALLVSFAPIGVFAAGLPSPSLAKMIYSNPAIHYELINYDDSFLALLDDLGVEITDYDEQFSLLFDGGYWCLDEALIIECVKDYDLVEWHFMRGYLLNEQVIAFLINDQTGEQLLLIGTILMDGNVIFNFDEIAPDVYYMFILRGGKN